MSEMTAMTHTILAELDMTIVTGSGLCLLAIGLLFVIILTIAYNKLKVERDPIVEAIEAVLPGANCGGCGLAGCSAYAEAVAVDHGLIGRCGPGGDELVRQIAAALGIEAAASAPIRPVVHCSAHTDDLINAANYFGVSSCAEAQMIGGAIDCPYGCLGQGDCVRACEFDAIHIVDGLAVVDYARCVGCGACAKACPRMLIEMVAMQEDPLLVVGCSSRDGAKEVRGYCKVGCVGCSLCAKMAPNMFQIKQKLAVIDYEKYGLPEERDKATGKCPRAMLVYVGKNASQTSAIPDNDKATSV